MLEHVPSTLSFPGAVSVKVTDAFSPDTVTTLPGIGMATFDSENAAPRMFPALVFKNEALVPEIPENTGPGGDSYLAVYQTSRVPVRNAQTGNYYVFRVVGSEAAHAPASLPEVRDQVLADMRSAKGFETAKQRAQAIRNALGTQPLQTAADADAELSKLKESNTSVPAGYYEPEPFPRVSRYQVANGRPPQGIYAGVGIGRLPNHVVDSIFQLAESEAKADVFELPERNVVLVVEAVELVRAPEDEINPLKDELEGQLAEARWREAVASWLDRKQLHARTGFSFATN
jgi:hypothetical protein